MKVLRIIIAVIATLVLAVCLVGLGFLACIAPPATHVLSSFFSNDSVSPFNRTQLTQVADATRDYSFGGHDQAALYRAIYQIDLQYRQEIITSNGELPVDFPTLDVVADANDANQLAAAFAGASELYCYSPQTVSHLDDCYNVAHTGIIVLIICGIAAVTGLILCGVLGRKRLVGNVVMSSGIVVLAAFVGLGVWAFIDFNGLFTMFHQVFFAQGNWTFPYDSLLICALPTEFWIGMGAIWLLVAVLISILSIAIGARLRK